MQTRSLLSRHYQQDLGKLFRRFFQGGKHTSCSTGFWNYPFDLLISNFTIIGPVQLLYFRKKNRGTRPFFYSLQWSYLVIVPWVFTDRRLHLNWRRSQDETAFSLSLYLFFLYSLFRSEALPWTCCPSLIH